MWFFKNTVEDAAENILDKDNGLLQQLGEWNGNRNFTEEEQAEHNKGIIEGVRKFAEKRMDESTDRSKNRRRMAEKWFDLQISLIALTAVAIPLDETIALSFFKLATSDVMWFVTGAITVFHWGSYGLARSNESKKGK